MSTGLLRRIHRILLAVVLCCVTFFGGGCQPHEETVERVWFMMDTTVEVQVTGEWAKEACEEMEASLLQFERQASMHVEGSDVWRINESAGKAGVQVSDSVYKVIEKAVDFGKESDGLFDVTIGPLSALWNIMSDTPEIPQPQAVEAALSLVSYEDILLTENNMVALAREGQKIDLGGIAKGYALDLCEEILDRYRVSGAYVSIGGNVLTYRDKNGEPFLVGIRYPETDRGGFFCVVGMQDTVISTTGGYERYFEADGVIYQHVLDPRTGYPVSGNMKAVSVFEPDGMLADCMSTRLFVGGLDYTLDLMRAESVEAIVVTADNKAYISESLRESVRNEYSDAETYEFIYI